MTNADLPAALLQRKAVVYIRQSSPGQVTKNPESRRRQYELVEAARHQGFRDIETIDDDVGRTAGGTKERPGFERLLALMYDNLSLERIGSGRNGRGDAQHGSPAQVRWLIFGHPGERSIVAAPTDPRDRAGPSPSDASEGRKP